MDSGCVYSAQQCQTQDGPQGNPEGNASSLLHLPPFIGLKASERTLVQNEWMEEKVPVIVATVSFGMGVDKANVR